MLRYFSCLILLLALTAACTQAAPATPTPPEEIQAEDGQAEDHHDEDHDEDHDDEDHHDDHDDEADHREHGAHEHGTAQLTLAWSGNQIAIDLETPAYNIVGFEYAPATEAEQSLLDESLAALRAGNLLTILAPSANCSLVSATVETELEEADEEVHDEADKESHTDIDVSYNIECQNPDKIEALDASQLFSNFPNLQQLQAQWVSDTQQSAKMLAPTDTLLPLVNLR